MTQNSITIDDKKFQAALRNMLDLVEQPKVPLTKMAAIVVMGIEENFDTQGTHWGSKWPETEAPFKRIRDWQGYRETPTLEVSGNLRTSIDSVGIGGYKQGVRIGFGMDYAEKMHNGEGGIATFTKKSGTASFSMPISRTHARQLIPVSRGFNADEISKMEKVMHDAVEKEWNKGAT